MFRLAAIVMLLLCPSLVWSQTIVGPTEPIEPRQPAWLAIEGVLPGSSATFFPSTQIQTGPPHIVPLHALFWAEQVGTYQINGVAVNVDWTMKTISLIPLTCTVVVEGDDPVPPPPPPPPPPAKTLEGVLFYRGEDLDNDLAVSQLIVSPRMRAIDKFTFAPYDVDTIAADDANLYPWVELVRANKWATPYLLLINESGDLSAHAPATTIDAAITLVKETLQ